ncbi:hypothetical protein DPMN_128654 [Dreissena polymorpha]|uniref:Uncharacterized protein n=1 Tax=Dreissena polymorpha TaxID=45954 RepID=A0A9D4JXM4_DREPO|nr:hypothetical protein DPMN_128654 [Dreissena polymorpha]
MGWHPGGKSSGHLWYCSRYVARDGRHEVVTGLSSGNLWYSRRFVVRTRRHGVITGVYKGL